MRDDRAAARKACRWLSQLRLPSADLELYLQRLLAMRATEVTEGEVKKDSTCIAGRFGADLPLFDGIQYTGDPALALAIYSVLQKRGIRHAGLMELARRYAAVLNESEPVLDSEFALVADLLRCCGFQVPTILEHKRSLPSTESVVVAGRKENLALCRLVASVTACGTRQIHAGDLREILPSLCVSYARHWDIEAVSVLLRACIYLRVGETTACRWALEWLMDQQQSDGRFGLLAAEARRLGGDIDDWKLYFHPTVSALWTLGESRRPGFLLNV